MNRSKTFFKTENLDSKLRKDENNNSLISETEIMSSSYSTVEWENRNGKDSALNNIQCLEKFTRVDHITFKPPYVLYLIIFLIQYIHIFTKNCDDGKYIIIFIFHYIIIIFIFQMEYVTMPLNTDVNGNFRENTLNRQNSHYYPTNTAAVTCNSPCISYTQPVQYNYFATLLLCSSYLSFSPWKF